MNGAQMAARDVLRVVDGREIGPEISNDGFKSRAIDAGIGDGRDGDGTSGRAWIASKRADSGG